jgi:DNA-binding CsgD family transcriptional regulator
MSTPVRNGSLTREHSYFLAATIKANSLCVAFGLALERRSDVSAPATGLLRLFHGDFLRIVRYPRGRGKPSVLFGTITPVSRWLVAPTADSLTNPLLSDMPQRPRAGTIWSLDDVSDSDLSDQDSRWQKVSMRYGLAEVVTLALETTPDHLDVVEIFCRTRLSEAHDAVGELVRVVAPILADLWSRRAPGAEFHVWEGQGANEPGADSRIVALSSDNPLGLTRCEFRICERVIRGFSVKRIAADLESSPHTVRSHLRNIFAKTGTDNQRALVVRLLQVEHEKHADAVLSA